MGTLEAHARARARADHQDQDLAFKATAAAINSFNDSRLTPCGEAGRLRPLGAGADELPLGMSVEVEAIVPLD